jgi:Protein of unknown function (DUF1176)
MTCSLARATAIFVCAAPAVADVPYLDDRSTAATLVKSLYNAVNRKEYARAFGYFSTPPARSFQAYVEGYETTRHVDVAIGTVTSEGAAGSMYYVVPVAIKSHNTDGSEKVFAGCYTLRARNAQSQELPFEGLRIEAGKLKASDASSVEGAIPDCGNDYQEDLPATVEEAITTYLATFENICGLSAAVASGQEKPDSFTLTYRQSGSNDTATAQLFRFPCSRAAYNESHVYLLRSGIEPLQPLALAQPDMVIDYQDENSATLTSMAVKGFSTSLEAVNSDFDARTQTILTFSKWRGIGDAATSASHVFADGRFVLWRFQVDPTFDEQINPYDVVVNGTVLPVPHMPAEAE